MRVTAGECGGQEVAEVRLVPDEHHRFLAPGLQQFERPLRRLARGQFCALDGLRTPRDLIGKFASADTLPPGMLMFCGTPGAIGGIRPAARFEMELHDPVLNRSLTHAYDVEVLPVIS